MQFLILHADKLIGKDIPFFIIIELIATNLAYMVVLAAPMAVLVATLMAFGRFSELNELTALRASGVNPFKVISPVLIASSFLCIFLIWFSNQVLPEANHKARSLFLDIRVNKPGFDLKPNIFYNEINDYTFLVEHIDQETDSLYNVLLFQDHNNEQKKAYIKAEKGLLVNEDSQSLSLYLFNGEMLSDGDRTRGVRTVYEKNTFQKHRITFDLADFSFTRSDPNNRSRSDRTMSSKAMLVVVDSIKSEINNQISLSSSIAITLPKSNRADLLVNSTSRLTDIDSTHTPPFQTEFKILNQLNSLENQTALLKKSSMNLKNYAATFQSAKSNLQFREKRVSKYWVEIYKKYSIPFACIVFILLGAPIGIMTRKGNLGYAAIISTVILTFYWVSLIQGEKLADRLFVSAFWGMWSFNILFGSIGIFLIIKLSVDLSLKRFLPAKRD